MTLPRPDMTVSLRRMIVRWPHRDLGQEGSRIPGQWIEIEIVDGRRAELNDLAGSFYCSRSPPYVGDQQRKYNCDPLKGVNPPNRRQETHLFVLAAT